MFPLETDPLWYKDAILYEVHVRAFRDSNADGIGDFRGLVEKLDYLQDLGITAIWLLPFYPSPLRDDGYDIADYNGVNPAYGTLADVRRLVREAHKRGLRVVTELVCNHTSDRHPWFRRARRAPAGSPERDFYVWSDTTDKYTDARIIFKDFEVSNWTWDRDAQAYYWHRFYSHQPDLNFDNSRVHEAIFKAMDLWLEMGVDGLRLDAIPYLYEREGTNCENLPETHEYLKKLRAHVDAKFPGRMLLAEANQWPEDAVAYFGDGDECHMCFHFPVMPRLFMAIRMEDRFPIADIMAQTPPIPDTSQWALFLRNHDELTLEMVTDEERDYMYRVYAHDPRMRINLGIRRRLAPLLGNNRRRIELMNALLFSLPGTPVVYYGDEIGMGDNVYLGDRDGVRTPMQWSADLNAGFSSANRQQLYLPVIGDPEYSYEAVNVDVQQRNQHSLLWWMKRMIALRKQHKAFGRGSLEFLRPDNNKVLAFIRHYEDEDILVVANLSRFTQYVELDLSPFKERVPVELFGRVEFPPVGDLPYFLTLGPHAFYWFTLEPQRDLVQAAAGPIVEVPRVTVPGWSRAGSDDLPSLLAGRRGEALAGALAAYIARQSWFEGTGRRIESARIRDTVPVPDGNAAGAIVLVELQYGDGEPQTYVLPLAYADGEHAEQLAREAAQTVAARVEGRGQDRASIVYDALAERNFSTDLLKVIIGHHRLTGAHGSIEPETARGVRHLLSGRGGLPEPSSVTTRQGNTSVTYGETALVKLFRRLDEGTNPQVEVGRFLSAAGFPYILPVLGTLDYETDRGERGSLAMLQQLVPSQGDAWGYTRDALRIYFDRALASTGGALTAVSQAPSLSTRNLLELVGVEPPELIYAKTDGYLESIRLLGQRTAELHRALSANSDDPAFAPEPFSTLYQRSVYQSMRGHALRLLQRLRRNGASLPEPQATGAQRVIELESTLLSHLHEISRRKIAAARTRTHGDYHLSHVLFTGKDFVIVQLEANPRQAGSERRIKSSPLRDVASMLCSFHYASYTALFGPAAESIVRPADLAALQPWGHFWRVWVSATFLRGYLRAAEGASFLPQAPEDLRVLLDAFRLDRSVAELAHELEHKAKHAIIPIEGILELLEPES